MKNLQSFCQILCNFNSLINIDFMKKIIQNFSFDILVRSLSWKCTSIFCLYLKFLLLLFKSFIFIKKSRGIPKAVLFQSAPIFRRVVSDGNPNWATRILRSLVPERFYPMLKQNPLIIHIKMLIFYFFLIHQFN